ncbi:MAG: S49 family peptidase, partial [Woeseiaceae bacterium]|nr:S49 family peptidase [Woeseiaceae bacterium]
MSKRNVVFRFFAAVWRALDGLRKVLHLVVLLFLFIIVFGAVSGTAPVLPQKAVLEIAPAGFLVEEYQGDPFDRALEELVGDAPPQTVVQDVIDALDYARSDDRIAGVHLNLGGLAGGGLSKLQRIGEAILEFRNSDKPIIASGDFFSQGGYYLAAHADEAYLHPEGLVLLQGYGSYRTYYKDAIDKLRLDWNIFRVGTHKSYIEPYTRMDMSDEAREDVTRLTGQLWDMYVSDVARVRGLDENDLRRFSDELVDLVRDAGGDFATAVLGQDLVDGLKSRREIRQRLIEIAGADDEFADAPTTAAMQDYLAQMRLLKGADIRDQNVAVVIASGEITFGAPAPGTIGADSTGRLLRRALNDDSVAAVVLRVDSPGGSTFASEVIANEVTALQQAGKAVDMAVNISAPDEEVVRRLSSRWLCRNCGHIASQQLEK